MSNTASPAPLTTLARQVSSTLHKAPLGICTCGPCRHQIRHAAHRAGVTPDALTAALHAGAKPAPAPQRPAPVRRPLTGRIGAVATISVNGTHMSLVEGLTALAQRTAE